MESLLFENALILSLKEGEKAFLGYLGVKDGKIAYINKLEPKEKYDKTFDCGGNLLMPGFKSAHAHSCMCFARSYKDDLPLYRWLNEGAWPLERCLRAGDRYYLAKATILEYLSSGITACFDQYFYPEEMAKASMKMGFRAVMCGTSLVNGSQVQSVADQVSSYLTLNKISPLISFIFGFHAEYTSSPELLSELSRASHFYKAPVYSHNSETKAELVNCKKNHGGLSPTEYTDSFGLYDYGGGGFHCLYLSDNDISIFKKHNLYVVSNPGSNSKLASGIAPLSKFLHEGLKVALGTDGPGSDNAMNMFYEMRLASVLQKLLLEDASAFPGRVAIKAAAKTSAEAMGLADSSTLEVGKNADIIMINLSSPDMCPNNDVEEDLVYNASKSDVMMTMIGGKILYEKGKFLLDESPEEILRKAKEITCRLKFDANK